MAQSSLADSIFSLLLLESSPINKWRSINTDVRNVQAAFNDMFRVEGKRVVTDLKRLPENATRQQIETTLNRSLADAFGLRDATRANSILQSTYPHSLNLGANRALRETGVNLRFDLARSPMADAFLTSRTGVMASINGTTTERLREITLSALEGGLTPAQLAARIKDQFREWGLSRSRMIAMAEVSGAYETGANIVETELNSGAAQLNAVVEHRWLTVGDDRVSEGCAENESAGWRSADQSFPSGHSHPPRHPRCRCSTETRVRRKRSSYV